MQPNHRHVLYVGDYKEKVKNEFAADCHSLRSITKDLAESTMLDPATISAVGVLQSRYRVLRETDHVSSIRLRELENVNGEYKLILGPEVRRPNMSTWKVDRLRLRPDISLKTRASVYKTLREGGQVSEMAGQAAKPWVGVTAPDYKSYTSPGLAVGESAQDDSDSKSPSESESLYAGSEAAYSIASETPLKVGEREMIELDEDGFEEAKYPAFDDLDKAILGITIQGPYLVGKVTLRAEFGRILLVHVDSSFKFHPGGREIPKSEMVEMLNEKYDRPSSHLCFTKILTNHGRDMLNNILRATSNVSGIKREIWNETPIADETTISYNFHCQTDNGIRFIVEILDMKANDAFAYQLHHVSEAGVDVHNAVYVHGLRRN